MAWIKCNSLLPSYDVTYVANGSNIIKKVKKGDNCIAVAPSVSKPHSTFHGWREDNRPIDSVISTKICTGPGIVLYAVWQSDTTHGGTITASEGYWGYDTNPDGSGTAWSTGAGGNCDGRCGLSDCGVREYYIWVGTGWNEPNGDGTYTPHPDYHGPLSHNWQKVDSRITVG